jgi:hypothetical protein
MSQAMQAGDVKGIRDILTQRFPGLQFETMDAELEEVDKPTETTPVVPPATDVTGETKKEETTATLYGDYMAGLPGGVRDLVTTDYKGVRGGRLGAGNYTTASMIPGAQVQTPSVPSTPASTPSTGGGTTTTTTYNAPVVGGNWQQYYGDYYSGDVNYGTIGGGGATSAQTTAPTAQTTVPTATGARPAWSATQQNIGSTVSKAAAGLAPSVTDRGTYVSPSSAQASPVAQAHFQTAQTAQQAGTGQGVRAIAATGTDTSKLGVTGVSSILAGPSNNQQAAQRALNQAEKGNITLTPAAREALQKAAKK